jgi:membrane protein
MGRAEDGLGIHDIEALRTGGARFIQDLCRLSGGERVMAVWALLRDTASRWSGHMASLLGAAIAYYSVFSLGPLMVIAIAIAGFVFGDDAARGEVSLELKSLLGETGAQAVQAMLAGAGRRHDGLVAGMIGVGTLLLAAIWVDTIWDVVAPPSGGVWAFAKSYLASLVGVLALGFLLLVSLLVTTVLAAGAAYITPVLSEAALHAINFLLSFAMVGLLFAMMFKWLPDTNIAWGDVRLGAIVTAALFEIGKLLIGLYIGKLALESTYGAAASIVVVLLWVYYNAQIVLAGAEFTSPPTVGDHQAHILVDWSRIDRLPAKSLREHSPSLPQVQCVAAPIGANLQNGNPVMAKEYVRPSPNVR